MNEYKVVIAGFRPGHYLYVDAYTIDDALIEANKWREQYAGNSVINSIELATIW